MKKLILGLCVCALMATSAQAQVSFATKALTSLINLTDSAQSIDLDLSSKNVPDSITVVTDSVDVSIFKSLTLYLNCDVDLDSSIATKYMTSPDGSNWFDGLVSITDLDTNKQVIVIDEANSGESAVKWFKLYMDRTNCAGDDSATVGAWLIGKTH